MNRKYKQTGLVIMDFTKEFDKISYKGLLYILDHYDL